jgi:hypothetical protein
MPRQPRPENILHPLKLLRGLLSQDPSKPVSQARLAERIDMSVNSIKMTEVGDREMSRPLKDKIAAVLGAVWSDERKRWEFSWSKDATPHVFSYELSCRYQEMIGVLPDPRMKVDVEGDIMRKIALLIDRVPPDRWWLMVLQWWEDIGAATAAFFPERGDDFDKEFGITELGMTVRFDPKSGLPIKITPSLRSKWLERDSTGKPTKLKGFAWSGDQESLRGKTMSREEFEALPGEALTAKELGEKLTSGKRRRPGGKRDK